MLPRLFTAGIPMRTLGHDTYSVSDPLTELSTLQPIEIPHMSQYYDAKRRGERKEKQEKRTKIEA